MRSIFINLVVIIGLISFGGSIFSSSEFETADENIKAAIEADYHLRFADSLESQKEQFTENSTLEDAQLGQGIAFNKISNDGSLVLGGYQFPLNQSGKQIALIEATNESGKWEIYNISNVSELGENLAKAKTNSNGNAHFKLIDDKSHGIHAVLINDANGERVMDLKSNKTLTKQEFRDSINKIKSDKAKNRIKDGVVQIGGTGSLSEASSTTTPSKTSLSLILLAVGIAVPIAYVAIRVKLRQKRS